MEFSHTNSIFNSLHYCLFGAISDNKLLTDQDVVNNFERELIDRIWCKLVYSVPSFESQHLDFMDEVSNNFKTFHDNDNRAIRYAGVLRNKVNKLLIERNLFVEKVALMWGTSSNEVLKWVDVDADFFIHDIKVRDNAENNKPYDYEHPEYKLAEYVGLLLAAIYQTIVFCQDYLDTYEQSLVSLAMPQTLSDKEPEPTGPGVKLQLEFNCKPAIAGYIINELVNKGYIKEPVRNNTTNYAELGRVCAQIFRLPEGFKTDAEGWRKAINPETNSLTDFKRVKLNLPESKDLA